MIAAPFPAALPATNGSANQMDGLSAAAAMPSAINAIEPA